MTAPRIASRPGPKVRARTGISGAPKMKPSGVIAADRPIIDGGVALPFQDEAQQRVAEPLGDGEDRDGRDHAGERGPRRRRRRNFRGVL